MSSYLIVVYSLEPALRSPLGSSQFAFDQASKDFVRSELGFRLAVTDNYEPLRT
jgi:hypothetical protein